MAGLITSGFRINLRTGESATHACSFGGAMLARSVATSRGACGSTPRRTGSVAWMLPDHGSL
jgi:hypothetical protein